jgi:Crp-like helix-turn-helix domain
VLNGQRFLAKLDSDLSLPRNPMSKNSASVSPSSSNDPAKNQMASKIVSLSPEELKRVLPKLELTRLKLHQILCEPGDVIKSGYFIDRGVVSVLAVQPKGKTVEVGLVGREGFVGLPLIVGYRTSPTRLIVQGDGAGAMLGTRRSSVTVSAGILQKAGLISHTRGNVKVLDRQKLEEAACDCYEIVQKQLREWEREAN